MPTVRHSFVVYDRGRVSPRQATYFLVCQKVGKEHSPIVCVPALRSGQTCVTQFSLRCGKTHCALAALRSNTLPQI